jgi:hypothetical protein
MSIQFLSEEQQQGYGRYVGEPTSLQLARYFHLDDTALKIVKQRRGDHNRLGFAVQLCTVRFLGTFLINPIDVPPSVVAYLALQLDISSSDCLPRYLERPTTHWEHAQLIKQLYGYRDFSSQPYQWRLQRWLYERAWVSDESPSVLFDLTTARLVENKILLPGVTVLIRLIGSVRERVSQRAWAMVSKLPTVEQQTQLESILSINEKTKQTLLDQLRCSPTRYSAPALVEALNRLVTIRAFGIRKLNVAKIPPNRLKSLTRTALTVRAQAISRMSQRRRIAVLVAFIYVIEAIAIDDTLDLLQLLVKDLLASSEREGKKERLRTLKDLDASALQLSIACRVLLDPNCDDCNLRSAVWKQISSEELKKAVRQVEELARPPDENYYKELLERWRQVRRFLPTLLRTIDFQSLMAGKPILAAWRFLASIEGINKPKMELAPLEVVSKSWVRWVVGKDGKIDRRAYTFCVLEQLVESLGRRDLFVSESERWNNPAAKLLQGQAWESSRSLVCRALNLQPTPKPELQVLQQQLNEAYQRTASNLPNNPAVRIEVTKGRSTLTISNLDKLEESSSYLKLKAQVDALLPHVDLPEVLLEIQAKTGFMDEFIHVNESFARVSDLSTSICAVLIASACNIGLTPLVRADVPALTRGRLTWVEQNYIRPETLVRANARLVDAQSQIPLAQAWGGGEVASADGLRFVVPVRTLNAGPNSKYFGQGRGVKCQLFLPMLPIILTV